MILVMLACFQLGKMSRPDVDLPEEWSLIKTNDNLKGIVLDGTLYLYFSNPDNSVIDTEYFLELDMDGYRIQDAENNKVTHVEYGKLDEFIETDNM